MARSIRARRRSASRQCMLASYLSLANQEKFAKKKKGKSKPIKSLKKNDWEDATCSVCMEFPHNAVLLLCSSHDKGCRPYMCDTSYRHSNCLDQFKKAYAKETSSLGLGSLHESLEHSNINSGSSVWHEPKVDITDLACPLCRGQLKGCTVVEPARAYLNLKKRSCTHGGCSFVGTYKELRKHVRAKHPKDRPHEIDPVLEQKWKRLEGEREREDVISTIRSSMPGAMVLGDYVIEHPNSFDIEEDDYQNDEDRDFEISGEEGDFVNVLFFLRAFGSTGNGTSLSSRLRRLQMYRMFGTDSESSPSVSLSNSTSTEIDIGVARSGRRRVRHRHRNR